jgi:energy-converting hydrogenase Eha subunit A
VEGLTGRIIAGLLLGYLAFLVFAIGSLLALGLLIARRTKAARISFAAGLLSATTLLAVAVIAFLGGEAAEQPFSATDVVAVLTLLLAGSGQFVAALQNPRTYAASLGCAAASLLLMAAPLLSGDAGLRIPGVHLLLKAVGLVPLALTSLLLAVVSLMVAVVLPFRPRQPLWARSEEGRGRT